MNLKEELQKLNLSDLHFISSELGLSSIGNKTNIIKLLLNPLSKKYRIQAGAMTRAGEMYDSRNNGKPTKYVMLQITNARNYEELKKALENIQRNNLSFPEDVDTGYYKAFKQVFLTTIRNKVKLITYWNSKLALKVGNILRKIKHGLLLRLIIDENVTEIRKQLQNSRLININSLYEGQTPLMIALLYYTGTSKQIEIVKLLLNAGADVNVVDKYIENGAFSVFETEGGQTALFKAASFSSHSSGITQKHKLVKLLLEAGADPNHLDALGNNALMIASHVVFESDDFDEMDSNSGAYKLIKLLLKVGANPTLTNDDGDGVIIGRDRNHPINKMLITAKRQRASENITPPQTPRDRV